MNRREHGQRLTAYLRGELSAEDTAAVEARLLREPKLAEQLIELAREEAVLLEWARSRLRCQHIRAEEQVAPPPARRRTLWIGAGLLAAAILLAVVLWNRSPTPVPENTNPRLATLDPLQGFTRVIRTDGSTLQVTSRVEILPGDTVQTRGPNSAAALIYADGTRLELIGTTSVTCMEGGRNHVLVHEGTVLAAVTPQPSAKAMLVTTPKAKLRVLGTRFSLAVTPAHTALSVTEGRVQVTQVRDGKSVEVAGGKRVVANGQADLRVGDIPAATAEWREDFENGLPAGWEIGEFVKDHLPAGSAGGVKPVLTAQNAANESFYVLVTQSVWPQGLCTISPETHLHFTCKFSKPGWVQILMGSRGSDGASTAAFKLYFLEPWGRELKPEEEWWHVPADTWYTVTIPLSHFRWATDRGQPPAANETCSGFTFSTQVHDRGLVLDRIWITRGGPNKVQFEPVR